MYRMAGKLECLLYDCTPDLTRHIQERSGPQDAPVVEPLQSGDTSAIVIGYGPVGQTVAQLLKENAIIPTIIELNVETVQKLLHQGCRAIYGDASRVDTLKKAGVADAEVLVISTANISGSNEIVKHSKRINPHIKIIARTLYLSDIQNLKKAGADVVFSDEGELALSVTELILRQSGATPEQIDRERDRIHDKLLYQAKNSNLNE